MNEVITRAIQSINNILQSSSAKLLKESKLIGTRDLLNRMAESSSKQDHWIRLFCRQLNRLMNYNESLTENFWIEIYDDILYGLSEYNGEQDLRNRWNYFHKRIIVEQKLEQRHLQFHQTFGRRKNLCEILFEHTKFLQEYLEKCISFHSKIRVNGQIENIDNLCEIYGQTQILNTLDNHKGLEEKPIYIEIDIDCSNKSLQCLSIDSFKRDGLPMKINNDLNNFLPSIEYIKIDINGKSDQIGNILQRSKWIVVLGDPGSGKSTLLRWITRIFAEAAYNHWNEVTMEGNIRISVRIPILIRIDEFAIWLKQYQTKALVDYVGEHTWFSKLYCSDDYGCVLKELIIHGHALILLDGLDEIPEAEYRHEITEHVRKFIDEYACTSEFFSAFDSVMFDKDTINSWFRVVMEKQSSDKFVGNQVIITSRSVGYSFCPIISPFVHHYAILPMNHNEAQKFIYDWTTQVEKHISQVLLTEEILLCENVMETISQRRCNILKVIMKNGTNKIRWNPSLLSMICMSIFLCRHGFLPTSRIEVYEHTIQFILQSYQRQNKNIHRNRLFNFLMNLAVYLHIQSPSGLIDTFDIEHLCYWSLQQYSASNDRAKIWKDVKELISLLSFNSDIVVEQGLQVYGFLHLTLQDYFVSQSLLRGTINDAAKRIVRHTIDSRFRESLLFALGWISWKWSFDDYNKFCEQLFSITEDYVIPLGALLFFDAVEDIQRLPANVTLFIALNSLFDHSLEIITRTYFIINLFRLPDYIIIEWMQLRLKDTSALAKFCFHLLTELDPCHNQHEINLKLIPIAVYQQLWSIHQTSISAEFMVDQTLRKIITPGNAPEYIFNNEFASYFSLHKVYISEVHPLILSVIIAVCGGISFTMEEHLMKIQFSTKHTHRETTVLKPVIEFLADNTQCHAVKLEILIEQYKTILNGSIPTDTEDNIIDTFIALICLQGVSNLSIYAEFDGYNALPLALDRLQNTWFYLNTIFDPKSIEYILIDKSFITDEIELIINEFYSQFAQSNNKTIAFSSACAAACIKLGITQRSNWSEFRTYCSNLDKSQPGCPSLCTHRSKRKKLQQMTDNIHVLQMCQHEPFFLLNFVPQSLQMLYYRIITISRFPLGVSLLQCLIFMENFDKDDANFYLALSIMEPLFKKHMLENYALVLFWNNNSNCSYTKKTREDFFKATNASKQQPNDWEELINIECQRIDDAKNCVNDSQLLTASVCLARLFQAQEQLQITQSNISTDIRNKVRSAIEDICNPVLQIIAWSIILEMKNSSIFDAYETNILQLEIMNRLQLLVPHLSLLESVLLFVQYHTIGNIFPVSFQQITAEIGKKLNETLNDDQNQDKVAAFIALQYFDNSHLSNYLKKFAERMNSSRDYTHFNSTIIHHYFTNRTSFMTSNTILLSTMYLVELIFDSQILRIYITDNHGSINRDFDETCQLWTNLSRSNKIMTVQLAKCITNYLERLKKEDIDVIIQHVSNCVTIEKEAIRVVETWLDYHTNEELTFFAHYAALLLTIEGLNSPNLTDIINQIFSVDNNPHLKSVIKHFFQSELVNTVVLRQILTILNEKSSKPSNILEIICHKKMLQLILDMEYERIMLDIDQLCKIQSNTFLSTNTYLSKSLEIYLIEYIYMLVDITNETQNIIKENFLASIIDWFTNESAWVDYILHMSVELSQCIFMILHDSRFPRAQKMILNLLYLTFIRFMNDRKLGGVFLDNVLLTDDAVTHLETIIRSWNTYEEEVLSVCLLTYGTCLRCLKQCDMDRNVLTEIQNTLDILFDKSLSKSNSIRAAFCLIFIQHSNITLNDVWSWLDMKVDLTPVKKYNIFLQLMLYKEKIFSSYIINNEIVTLLQKHSSELMHIFISEFYSYLSDKGKRDYFSDAVPDYIYIGLELIEKDSMLFYNAVQESYYGEENFMTKLYLCHTNNAKIGNELIDLYTTFDLFTMELANMLAKVQCRKTTYECLKNIKKISDRDVIERLFQILNLSKVDNVRDRFIFILMLLIHLAQSHFISLIEVHQNLLLIFKNVLYSKEHVDQYYKKHAFAALLDLSCIKKTNSTISRNVLYSSTIISEKFTKFKKKLYYSSVLFHRTKYFIDSSN